ncbi:MAG TPA: multicopper oxidase domain-containing protein, partial [Chloroflexota bacterium]|nr:multicopper oxidase domain-containing protein [Chloroflexota bacterium]
MHRALRRARAPWLLGPVALGLVITVSLFSSPAPASSTPVFVEHAPAGSDAWQSGAPERRLRPGDRLRTGAASSTRATLPDGSVLALGSASGVRLDSLEADSVVVQQAAGTTQAQVAPASASAQPYRNETAAAITSAPPATCPWVRVNPDGSVLVRNYGAGPLPAVAPQLVDQVYYAPVLVEGPDGRVPVPMPRTVPVLQDFPAGAPAEERLLDDCPAADGAADTDAPDAAPVPLLGSLDLPRLGARQPTDRALRVRNTYGERIQTPFADGQRMKVVLVPPGHETLVQLGETPAPPEPIGTYAARAAATAASAEAAERLARDVARAESRAVVDDPAASLAPGLLHHPLLGAGGLADLFRLLAGAPLPADVALAQGLQSPSPCATAVGGHCSIVGKGVFGECTKIGSMSCFVRVSLPGSGLGGVPPLLPQAQVVTSLGIETLRCATPASGAQSVTCTGILAGDAGLGATVTVQIAPGLTISGTVGQPSSNALREPPVRSSVNGVLDTTLAAQVSPVTVAGQTVLTNNYEGSYPGPTLHFRPGDNLRVKLINNLGGLQTRPIAPPVGNQLTNSSNATNLHVHGLHVSPFGTQGDNVLLTIPPGGASNQYSFLIPFDHPSGLYWYHPHFHGTSDKQIFTGMMGTMIVEGGLDRIPGIGDLQERLMVIHQIQLSGRGGTVQQVSPQTPQFLIHTVNGQYQPTIHMAPGQTQRWRLANTSADGTVVVFLEGHTFNLIATDGNTLSQPVPKTTVELQPANRAEVLVTCQGPGTYQLRVLPFFQGAFNIQGSLLGTVVCDGPAWNPQPIPSTLLPVTDLRALPVAQRRTFVFTDNQGQGVPGPPSFFINGLLFDPFRVDVRAKLGTVEEWTMTN